MTDFTLTKVFLNRFTSVFLWTGLLMKRFWSISMASRKEFSKGLITDPVYLLKGQLFTINEEETDNEKISCNF